jgi:hypothetical protein
LSDERITVHLDDDPRHEDPGVEKNYRLKPENLLLLLTGGAAESRQDTVPSNPNASSSAEVEVGGGTQPAAEATANQAKPAPAAAVSRKRAGSAGIRPIHDAPPADGFQALIDRFGEKMVDSVLIDFDLSLQNKPAFHFRLEAFKHMPRRHAIDALENVAADNPGMDTTFDSNATPTQIRIKLLHCLLQQRTNTLDAGRCASVSPSSGRSSDSEPSSGQLFVPKPKRARPEVVDLVQDGAACPTSANPSPFSRKAYGRS